MPTVAEQLREAREARNLSYHQVAEIMKIRTDHLQALEAGDFSVFAAPVYIRGFVRTYAKLLKLDVKQIMANLESELGKDERFSQTPPLIEGRRTFLDVLMLTLSKIDWRRGLMAVGGAVLLVAVIAFVASRHRTPPERPKGARPAVTNRPPVTLPAPPRKR
jgi:cytoskeletal protein RodZ